MRTRLLAAAGIAVLTAAAVRLWVWEWPHWLLAVLIVGGWVAALGWVAFTGGLPGGEENKRGRG